MQPYGRSVDASLDPTVMRACSGQLAWVANPSRPAQSFLASCLQGVQAKTQDRYLIIFKKVLRGDKIKN